jgi:hypothetical protein
MIKEDSDSRRQFVEIIYKVMHQVLVILEKQTFLYNYLKKQIFLCFRIFDYDTDLLHCLFIPDTSHTTEYGSSEYLKSKVTCCCHEDP